MIIWLRKYPCVGMLAALAVGILLAWCTPIKNHLTLACYIGGAVLLGFCLLLLLLTVFCRRYQFLAHDNRSLSLLGVAVVGLCLSLLGFWHTCHDMQNAEMPFAWQDSVCFYRLQLLDEPIRKANTWQAEAYVLDAIEMRQISTSDSVSNCLNIDSKEQPKTHNHVRVMLSLETNDSLCCLQGGDLLVGRMRMQRPQPADPYSFDYATYLQQNGIAGTAYVRAGEWRIVGYERLYGVLPALQLLRSCIEQRLAALNWRPLSNNDEPIFPQRELSIIQALVLGDRRAMEADTREQFAAAGAMHVLAVSGLHVGIVWGIIMYICSLAGRWQPKYDDYKKRYLQCGIAIVVLWCYALLTGLSASVFRSVLMFSILSVGVIFRPGRNRYNEVAASALIILFVQPMALLQTGLILSYSAVLAILAFTRPLQKCLGRKNEKGFPLLKNVPVLNRLACYVSDLLIVSLAAQIGTLPWTMYFFGRVSVYFALTNILVLPLVGLLIPCFFVLLAVIWVPYLAPVVGIVVNALTWLLCESVAWVQQLPHSTADVSITFAMAMALVVMVISWAFMHRHFLTACSVSVLMCLVYTSLYVVDCQKATAERTQHTYHQKNGSTLMIQDGRHALIITDDSITALSKTAAFRRSRRINDWRIIQRDEDTSLGYLQD